MDEIPSDFLASGSLDSAVRRLRGDLIGQQIGVYRVTSLLGAGGMGEVFRAHDGNLIVIRSARIRGCRTC